MGSFSNLSEATLLDYLIGTLGNNVSLHVPLSLNADVISGASTLQVDKNDFAGNAFAPVAGDKIGIGGEEHKISAVTDNTTYWTLSLDTLLAASYTAGEPIGYGGESSMPTELAFTGYARQSPTWSAASQGNPTTKETSGEAAFGDPDVDGKVGSFGIYDAALAGNLLIADPLNAVVSFQSGVTDPLSFPAGSLTITLD